jgi:hypothetical protein
MNVHSFCCDGTERGICNLRFAIESQTAKRQITRYSYADLVIGVAILLNERTSLNHFEPFFKVVFSSPKTAASDGRRWTCAAEPPVTGGSGLGVHGPVGRTFLSAFAPLKSEIRNPKSETSSETQRRKRKTRRARTLFWFADHGAQLPLRAFLKYRSTLRLSSFPSFFIRACFGFRVSRGSGSLSTFGHN